MKSLNISGTELKFTLPLTFENIVRTLLEWRCQESRLIIELVRAQGVPEHLRTDQFGCAKPVSAWHHRNGKLTQLPEIPEKQSWTMPWLEVEVTGPNTFYYGFMLGRTVGHGNTVTVDENGHPTFQRNWVS